LVIIESNDYNTALTHYVITGAQVLPSTYGLTGSGISFNPITGALGGSSGTEAFDVAADSGNNHGGTNDGDVIKISDIGVVTQSSATQDASLVFQVVNVDADGDKTASQTLNVTIEGSTSFVGTASAESIQGTAGNDTIIGNGGNDILTGSGGNDLFVLQASNGGHDDILDFVSGADDIVVDVASLNLTIGTSSPLAAANFHTGDENVAATWNGGTGNEFVFNAATKELWYSANGTGSDKVDLAHISTGIPAATDVHTF